MLPFQPGSKKFGHLFEATEQESPSPRKAEEPARTRPTRSVLEKATESPTADPDLSPLTPTTEEFLQGHL